VKRRDNCLHNEQREGDYWHKEQRKVITGEKKGQNVHKKGREDKKKRDR